MPSTLTLLLLTIVVLAIIIPSSSAGGGVFAFGAGNIPGFAYLEGKAFRHGDIEDVLAELLKKTGSGSGFLGIVGIGKGTKFGGLDVKRVYFGNWLRDYSQAVDIASLQKVQLQTILNIIMVLGFLSNGYATGAFEVTAERLGTYLPVEHIDNPKGYGEGEDPRKYHPKLRGPVHPQEYAIDPKTGMKNYIANEEGFWDTSKAHVRRLIEGCIHYGRQYRQSKNQDDKFEAYRLLGSALHTMEDFFAHSNFCELALISIGGWNVFPHVGDKVKIRAPNGQYVHPLVTGTFGGSDFIHSLLGEATDHISQTSISELDTQIKQAQNKQNSGQGLSQNIKKLTETIPGFGAMAGNDMSRDLDNMERTRASNSSRNPNDMSPQEIRGAIWPILVFRDNLVTKIETVIEKIPGLQSFIDSLMESIQVFVLTALEPYIRPLITNAAKALTEQSGAVINNHDQFEVFNDSNASDPTHSFLSKDHFNTILNEPAGNLAKIVVMYAVPLITAAWDNPNTDPRSITQDILQCFFHPDWHDRSSKVQIQVMQYMGTWMNSHGSGQAEVARRLSKESVRRHENMRFQGQAQGVVSVASPGHTPAPNYGSSGGGGGSSNPTDLFATATGMLNKFGVSTPGGGVSREFQGGGYGGPPPGPPPMTSYPQAPQHQAHFNQGPSYPPPGGAPPYSPPVGAPPVTSGSRPGERGGYGFPSAGPGFPSSKTETKEEKKARKAAKKANKAARHGHSNYDNQTYHPSDSDDSDDSDDRKNRHMPQHHQQPPMPNVGGHHDMPQHGHPQPHHQPSYHGGPPGGGYPLRDREEAAFPSAGGSNYYNPPSGPPPGGSSFGMPSAPGGPPPFPPAPGFGGPPSFPMGGNMPASAFPGMGGGGFPAPGGPPAFPGGPSFPGAGGGYPGAGGRHQYDGSSSGW